MANLIKPYRLSLCAESVNQEAALHLQTIGSDTLQSQSKAFSIKLIQNTNGSQTLTFSIFYQYIDTRTGEKVENPWAALLCAERKLLLDYDGETFYFIIKSVTKDSAKYTLDIVADDRNVNELAKNGYGVTLDEELSNNYGTVTEIAKQVLKNTNWTVDEENSDKIPDVTIDTLVKLRVTSGDIKCLMFTGDGPRSAPTIDNTQKTLAAGAEIYAFYGCCHGAPRYFSFLTELGAKDSEDIYINRDNQGYLINPVYVVSNNFQIPQGMEVVETLPGSRGRKYIWSSIIKYFPSVQQYLSKYQNNIGASANEPKTLWGYAKTDYVVPYLVSEYIPTGSNMTSTAGWIAGAQGTTANLPKVEYQTYAYGVKNGDEITVLTQPLKISMLDYLLKDIQPFDYQFKPYIHFYNSSFGDGAPVLFNSGPFDTKMPLSALAAGKKYRFEMQCFASNAFEVRLGLYNYDAKNQRYVAVNSFYIASCDNPTGWTHGASNVATSVEATITVPVSFTEDQYKQSLLYLAIIPAKKAVGSSEDEYIDILNCSLFEYVPTGAGTFLRPTDTPADSLAVTRYRYYTEEELAKTNTEDIQPYLTADADANKLLAIVPVSSWERRRTISVKQSNYYAILQTLCEKFECWMRPVVSVSPTHLEQKKIVFKNYAGKENFAGFRYRANLKSIKRSDDSKTYVTKLIVSDNSNAFGEGGFCSIRRAPSNPSKDTVLYNMDYYIAQGILSADAWNSYVYGTNGYYAKMAKIISESAEIAGQLTQAKIALIQMESDYERLTLTVTEAQEAVAKAERMFVSSWGYGSHSIDTEERKAAQKKSPRLLIAVANAEQAYSEAQAQLRKIYWETNGKIDGSCPLQIYRDNVITLQTEATAKADHKAILEQQLYAHFSHFIQEGTWKSDDYSDDEKYYLDAVTTLAASAKPKASYTLSVADVSGLDGYEDYTFALGDSTYIEDGDFFGYSSTGAPLRATVVLTEMVRVLDDPSKNTIKIQTYVNLFQDLFRKMAATTQQISYAKSGYDKAAALANGNAEDKSSFLKDAWDDPRLILQNIGQQTVTWDAQGITATSADEPSKKVRIVNRGVLVSKDGGQTWATGISADGVNTEMLTAGIINTDTINIMNADEPSFRWDKFGLTAFDFTVDATGTVTSFDTKKGVRFDRFGLYGFTGVDGAGWHPNSIQPIEGETTDSISAHASFYLTWDGLHVSRDGGKSGDNTDILQNVDIGYIPVPNQGDTGETKTWYTGFSEDGRPIYDSTKTNKIVPVMRAGQKDNYAFTLYSDGTVTCKDLFVTGNVKFATTASPARQVYHSSAIKPEKPKDGTWLDEFPEQSLNETPVWHTLLDTSKDYWYSQTWDGGTTWSEPLILQGKNGKDGQDVIIKASREECTAAGHCYIDAETGILYMLAVVNPREFINCGKLKGPKGDAGAEGAQGPVGPAGPQGAQGPAGKDGPQGPAGKDGVDGKDGADGTSVTIKGSCYVKVTTPTIVLGASYAIYSDVAYQNQITGAAIGDGYISANTEETFAGYLFVYNGSIGNSFVCTGQIKGPQGEKGATGDKGEKGEKGDPGEPGAIGPQGPQGPIGATGKDAPKITSVVLQYTTTKNTDNGAATRPGPDAVWSANIPAVQNGYSYWVRTITTYDDEGHTQITSDPALDSALNQSFQIADGKNTISYITHEEAKPVNAKNGDCCFEQAAGKSEGTLQQYYNGEWIDIGDKIVAKSVTAERINALNIITKLIEVKSGQGTIFLANANTNKVTIGGFDVNEKALFNTRSSPSTAPVSETYYMTSPSTLNQFTIYNGGLAEKDYIYMGTDGIGAIKLKQNKTTFKAEIDKQTYITAGEIFSNYARIEGGYIKGGYVGGWHLSDNTIYTLSDGATESFLNGMAGLYCGKNYKCIKNSTDDGDAIRFWAGNSLSYGVGGSGDPDAIPFKVSHKGEVWSKSLHANGDLWANTARVKNLIVSDAKASMFNGLIVSGGLQVDELVSSNIKDPVSQLTMVKTQRFSTGDTPTVHSIAVRLTDANGNALGSDFGYGTGTTGGNIIVTATISPVCSTKDITVMVNTGYVTISSSGQETELVASVVIQKGSASTSSTVHYSGIYTRRYPIRYSPTQESATTSNAHLYTCLTTGQSLDWAIDNGKSLYFITDLQTLNFKLQAHSYTTASGSASQGAEFMRSTGEWRFGMIPDSQNLTVDGEPAKAAERATYSLRVKSTTTLSSPAGGELKGPWTLNGHTILTTANAQTTTIADAASADSVTELQQRITTLESQLNTLQSRLKVLETKS